MRPKLVEKKRGKACFEILFMMSFYLASICFFIGNAINYFPQTASLLYLVVIGVGTTFLHEILFLNVYIGVTLLINCIGMAVISSTCIDKSTYLFYLIGILILTYFTAYHRINKAVGRMIFEKTTFNEIMDAILILEEETLTVIECNHKALELFHKQDGLIGKNIEELLLNQIEKKATCNHLSAYLKNRNKEWTIRNEKFNNMWMDLHIKKFQVLGNSYMLIRIADVSAHKRHEEEMEYLAYHDILTNLPNRRYGEEKLKEAIEKTLKKKNMLGVMFVDLDEFKIINDTLGHAAGDDLLKKVAIRLQRSVRKNDVVARLGGDEFMIILEDVELMNEVITIADRMIHIFSQPFMIKEKKLYITCSIGVAIFPQNGADMAALMDHADRAMYQAKMSGRNNFKVFNDLSEHKILSCHSSS